MRWWSERGHPITHADAAIAGVGAALVAFGIFVAVWWIAQRLTRKRVSEGLDLWLSEAPGEDVDDFAAGLFLYVSLAAIPTVDYEKHTDVRRRVARVLRKVPAA